MSPSDDRRDIPPTVEPVVRRYHRLERLSGWALAAGAALLAVAAVLSLPFAVGLLVAVTVLAVLRVPVRHRRTASRLVSAADPEAVAADFEGPAPPMLVFQWGLADGIYPTDDGARYEFSYLFGLRSASMTTDVRTLKPDDGPERRLEIAVAANGEPWARYTVSIREGDGETVVECEGVSERRFGLRRLPQALVAGRYYADALSVQGYAVADRTASFPVRSPE